MAASGTPALCAASDNCAKCRIKRKSVCVPALRAAPFSRSPRKLHAGMYQVPPATLDPMVIAVHIHAKALLASQKDFGSIQDRHSCIHDPVPALREVRRIGPAPLKIHPKNPQQAQAKNPLCCPTPSAPRLHHQTPPTDRRVATPCASINAPSGCPAFPLSCRNTCLAHGNVLGSPYPAQNIGCFSSQVIAYNKDC